jgi:hypothetical protein
LGFIIKLDEFNNKIYIYIDYLTFNEEVLIEIVDGRILGMWPEYQEYAKK